MAKKVVWVLGVEHSDKNLGMVLRAIRFFQRNGMKTIALELAEPGKVPSGANFFKMIEAERKGKTRIRYLEHPLLERKMREWNKKSYSTTIAAIGEGPATGNYANYFFIASLPLRDRVFARRVKKLRPDVVVVGQLHAGAIRHYLEKEPGLEIRTISSDQIRRLFSLEPRRALPRLLRRLKGDKTGPVDDKLKPDFDDSIGYKRYNQRQLKRGTKKRMPRPI